MSRLTIGVSKSNLDLSKKDIEGFLVSNDVKLDSVFHLLSVFDELVNMHKSDLEVEINTDNEYVQIVTCSKGEEENFIKSENPVTRLSLESINKVVDEISFVYKEKTHKFIFVLTKKF